MTQTATRQGAQSTAATPGTRILEMQVTRPVVTLLNKLGTTRMARLLAERAERPHKDKLKEIVDNAVQEYGLVKGDILVVKTGDTVRGKITIRDRGPKVDYDLLAQAFPEAYEQCVSRNESPQFDTV